MSVIYAASSFYEILLIVLVIILISNGLLIRRNIRKQIINISDSEKDEIRKKDVQEGEYVDYEIIKE